MNPTPDYMQGTAFRQQSNRLRGSSERIYTAVVQMVCGIIAIVCGLVLVLLKHPDDDSFYGNQLSSLGKTAFGIWGGLVFIATAIPYFFKRNSKCMVGLYFGFCLTSALIAVVGLGLSMTAVNRIVYTTTDDSDCSNVVYRDWEHRCCFEDNRYSHECSPHNSYPDDFYSYSYRRNIYRPTEYPKIQYDSKECDLFRRKNEERVELCIQERMEFKRMYAPYLAFHGILIAIVSFELLASIYGAGASLSALCDCCVAIKPTHHYPFTFNQLLVNDSFNNTMIATPVNTQQPCGPAVITTTEVPYPLPPDTGLRY